jgi:transcriptional antiterminator RfaH
MRSAVGALGINAVADTASCTVGRAGLAQELQPASRCLAHGAASGEAISSVFWYAVHTKPKQEERAELNLRGWGIETFAPRLRQARVHPTRATSYRVGALFPRYIFVRVRPTTVGQVRLTRGVHSVVGFGGSATPVDDGLIALIRSRLDADGVVRSSEPRPGDVVRIIEGPLRSLEGLFERELKAQDRVLILLHTIGAQAHVQVPKAFIRQAADRPGGLEDMGSNGVY